MTSSAYASAFYVSVNLSPVAGVSAEPIARTLAELTADQLGGTGLHIEGVTTEQDSEGLWYGLVKVDFDEWGALPGTTEEDVADDARDLVARRLPAGWQVVGSDAAHREDRYEGDDGPDDNNE